MSIFSCKALQVADKVSDVPNSKYHSLFFILKLQKENIQFDKICTLNESKFLFTNIQSVFAMKTTMSKKGDLYSYIPQLILPFNNFLLILTKFNLTSNSFDFYIYLV